MSGRAGTADAHAIDAFRLAFRTVIFASAASAALGALVTWPSVAVAGGSRRRQPEQRGPAADSLVPA
jgi:hypothetical protein